MSPRRQRLTAARQLVRQQRVLDQSCQSLRSETGRVRQARQARARCDARTPVLFCSARGTVRSRCFRVCLHRGLHRLCIAVQHQGAECGVTARGSECLGQTLMRAGVWSRAIVEPAGGKTGQGGGAEQQEYRKRRCAWLQAKHRSGTQAQGATQSHSPVSLERSQQSQS